MTPITDLSMVFDNSSDTLNNKASAAYVQYDKQNAISQAERQRKQQAWDNTIANFALEDIYPSEEIKRIGLMYINGEISIEQQGEMMRKAILAEV
ncbi:antitoxin VbhA family protein [Moraxella marmotae]|uniref:antitoxin VbhA family protein n=1 Tax=Moraxella marmotae TaxID=3344520 RepID=UPI0035F362D4